MDAVIELEIGPGTDPGTYVVHVLRSMGGGEPTSTFTLDVGALVDRRDQLEASVLASSVSGRSTVAATEAAIQGVGQQLFDAVFQGDVHAAYRTSLAVAADRGTGVQVALRLTAPGLAALPWEALFDSETGAYLCRREPLVRRVSAPHPPRALSVEPPLRILGMVSSPRGLPPLDVEHERELLEEALRPHLDAGRVQIDWVDPVTLSGVHDHLLEREWHVLHFIGHGTYDTESDEGLLAFVGRDGRADYVTASSLADLLDQAEPSPRLVLLNSRSFEAGGADPLFSGAAAALAHSGVQAVAAMQFTITDGAAMAFARGFYAALSHGRTIEEAVRSGRIGILGLGRGTLEWVTPVLYLRGDDPRLFDVAPTGEPTAAAAPVEMPADAAPAPGASMPSQVTDPPRGSPPPSAPKSAGRPWHPGWGWGAQRTSPGDEGTHRAYPVLRPRRLARDGTLPMPPRRSFVIEVGIGPHPDPDLVAPVHGVGGVRSGSRITVHLAYDPTSLRLDPPGPIELKVTRRRPYPIRKIRVTVLPLDDPDVENRRIAAHYFIDGELRAIAFRAFRPAAAAPEAVDPRTPSMVDLTPLWSVDPPDVVLAVYAADTTAAGSHVMALFPRSAEVAPPEVARITVDATAADLMTQMFESASVEHVPVRDILTDLAGKGVRIGNAIPDPVLAALQAVVDAAPPERAPRLLLLTEDASLPWELAAFPGARALRSARGGRSPYLGAHFGIGRWPLSRSRRVHPAPRPETVNVYRAALVTADYQGVGAGWNPLPAALAEIEALKLEYQPAIEWFPLLDEVLMNLSSDVNVIHFALHGQFTVGEREDGLVLLRNGPSGLVPAYLGADTILGLTTREPKPLPGHPFVFLNACQVGRGHRILGDYAGLASAFLEAGARGVVACIWNVSDGIAGSIAHEFYRRADAGEPPAEILRDIRARCASDAEEGSDALSPTLLAYQFFGHPNMKVQHPR